MGDDNSVGKLLASNAAAIAVTGSPDPGSIVNFLWSWFDPGRRRVLEEQMMEHVLEEIPRVAKLLEERIEDVRASGCGHEEANVIAFQVIEAQQRTLDDEKRRRLSNVLVNGLCKAPWNKVEHRLMVRLTSQLEEEHIARLRWEVRTFEEQVAAAAARARPEQPLPSLRERQVRTSVSNAIERELVSLGLLNEKIKPKVTLQKHERVGQPRTVSDVAMESKLSISHLGLALLEHLAEPLPRESQER